MAKVKQPLLSMGMSGTIGRALTGQRTRRLDILREKPTPKDPYSLPQAYHRWNYQDYLAWWATFTATEKRVYAAAGSRTHNTAVGAFLQEHLSNLPDILSRYRMDEIGGAVAHDSSKADNDGAIIGATPVDGQIAGGFYFDGINDWINCGQPIDLAIDSTFSIDLFIKAGELIGTGASNAFELYKLGTNRLYLMWPGSGVTLGRVYAQINGVGHNFTLLPAIDLKWHHLLLTFAGTLWTAYMDGALLVSGNYGDFANFVGIPTLGLGGFRNGWFKGTLDNFTIYDRALTLADAQLKSARRYPS